MYPGCPLTTINCRSYRHFSLLKPPKGYPYPPINPPTYPRTHAPGLLDNPRKNTGATATATAAAAAVKRYCLHAHIGCVRNRSAGSPRFYPYLLAASTKTGTTSFGENTKPLHTPPEEKYQKRSNTVLAINPKTVTHRLETNRITVAHRLETNRITVTHRLAIQ